MSRNMTALEGLHVIREMQELEYDARMLQASRLVFSQSWGGILSYGQHPNEGKERVSFL